MAKTLYEILGLARTASTDEIKAAHRRLIKQCHPDRFPDRAEVFRAVQHAYEVLTDPTRRMLYDGVGLDGTPRPPRPPRTYFYSG